MLRLYGTVLIITVICMSLLAGCGGGGGGGGDDDDDNNNGGTTPTTEVTMTGKLVSSADNTKGVAGIVIRYGAAFAITDSTGAYSLKFNSTVQELPYYLTVDTSGAGSLYPATYMVSLADGQIYDPGEVDVPLAMLNGSSSAMPNIIVQEVSDENPGLPPYPNHNGMVYGRVIRKSTGAAVVGATVKLGDVYTPVQTTTTGARGYFAFDLGKGNMLVDVVGTARTFSVDVSAVTGLDSSYQIDYASATYYQNQAIGIAVDSEIIGLITVNDSSSGGGEIPPPPPL